MPSRLESAPAPRLEIVLGHPDFRTSCDRLIRALGSIIYAWVRQGRVLLRRHIGPRIAATAQCFARRVLQGGHRREVGEGTPGQGHGPAQVAPRASRKG